MLTAICPTDITKMYIVNRLLLYVLNTFCYKLLDYGDNAGTCRS